MDVSENTIKELYVENKYQELLLLRDEVIALCNYKPDNAQLLLPLLIKCHTCQFTQEGLCIADKQDALYNEFVYIMKNSPICSIPTSMMTEM